MRLLKTALLAGLFGVVTQWAVVGETKPVSYPATVAQSAERFLAAVQADVSGGIQTLINSKTIAAKDLDSLLTLLNSCALKLRDAGYDEKLSRASQQVESVNSQMVEALKDPGNKEVFATGLEPEKCLQQIRLQKASGMVLEKKLIRLKNIVEELRKAVTILEPITPADQLDERIKLRLTQLLAEWDLEPGIHKTEEGPRWVKERSNSGGSNVTEVRDSMPETKAFPPVRKPLFGSDSSNVKNPAKMAAPHAITMTPAAERILKMSQEGVREKAILKQINNSSEQFRLKTADQILYLRSNNVSSPVIAAMLNRDTALEELKR